VRHVANVRLASGAVLGLLAAVSVALTVVTGDPWASNDGLTIVLTVLIGAVGLLVVGKEERNAVGWLMVATALIGLFDAVDRLYLVVDYRRHNGAFPLGRVAVDWRGGVALLAFLVAFPAVLLFPDGRIPSPRWRRALTAYAVLATVFSVLQFVGEALDKVPRHPLVDIRGNVPNLNPGTAAGFAWFTVPLFLGFWIACVGHQARSWRRAHGERRAQLKWLATGSAVCIIGAVVLVGAGNGNSVTARIAGDAGVLAIGAFPAAIGVGILRYRLYEIDRLISRTISYTLVTGALIGLFLGLVVLTTDVLPFSSPIGVAASTLTAAAVFNPLRRRVQHLVDRRFNRARYDAESTVTHFAQRLRSASDVEAVEACLRETVGAAVEPVSLAVWLRPE